MELNTNSYVQRLKEKNINNTELMTCIHAFNHLPLLEHACCGCCPVHQNLLSPVPPSRHHMKYRGDKKKVVSK